MHVSALRCLLLNVLLHFREIFSYTCYCTFLECGDAFCTGDACLVGFRKNDRSIIYQSCASEQVAAELQPCKVDFQEWDEVCRCLNNNCNSYSFFRSAAAAYFEAQGDGKKVELVLTERERAEGTNTTNIVVLIVCVPVVLALFTMIMIFVNYQCRL